MRLSFPRQAQVSAQARGKGEVSTKEEVIKEFFDVQTSDFSRDRHKPEDVRVHYTGLIVGDRAKFRPTRKEQIIISREELRRDM